jgi:parallel beta-helix repeat protein
MTTAAPTLVRALGRGDSGETITFNSNNGRIYHASGLNTPIFESFVPPSGAITDIPVSGFEYFEATALTFSLADGLFLMADLDLNFMRVTTGGVVTFVGFMDHTSKGFAPVTPGSTTFHVDCSQLFLQDAIDAAQPGDVVLAVGACLENITMRNDERRLTVDGGGTATIDGPSSSSPAVNIRGKGIVIRGFTITGGSVGIDVNRGSNVFIDGNTIENTGGAGILLQEGTFGGIINNTIQNNPGAGIVVSGNSTARIGFSEESDTVASENTIQGNAIGVEVTNGSSAWIVGNEISDNTGDGVLVTRRSSADISSNAINSNGGDGVEIRDNSVVQLGEDSGSSIFASPNSTSSNNTGVGVRCATGGVADGRRGTLTGTGGPTAFAGTCIDDLN